MKEESIELSKELKDKTIASIDVTHEQVIIHTTDGDNYSIVRSQESSEGGITCEFRPDNINVSGKKILSAHIGQTGNMGSRIVVTSLMLILEDDSGAVIKLTETDMDEWVLKFEKI